MARSSRIGALDGLRALAVAAVLLFHQGFEWASGGYLGVDLFFVLSGYLIAGKLINERRASGRINVMGFWAGRFRRLLPALLFVLLGVVAYTVLWAEPTSKHSIRIDVLASLAYVVNWRFILEHVGYFASATAPSPVRHLWSLSVEEQFYLIFPLLLIFLSRRARSARQLVPAIATLVVISTVWTGWLALHGASDTRMYEGTDCRLATILLGVLAAVIVRTWRRPPALLGPVAGVCGVVAVAIAVFARGDSVWMYPMGQLSFALMVAVVVVACATIRTGRTIGVLSSAPFVWLGAISYSLYLWHWPLYLILTPDRTGFSGVALFALRVALSIVMAMVSYYLIEQPIRHRRVKLPHPAWMGVAGVAVVAALIIAVTAGAPTGDQLAARTGPVQKVATPPIPTTFRDLGLPPGVTLPPAAPTGRPLKVGLVGDSVAFSLDYYSPEIQGITRQSGTIIGCGVMAPASPYPNQPPLPDCVKWKETWARALSFNGGPDIVLMITGAWEIKDHWLNGKKLTAGTPEAAAYVDSQLDQAVDVIRSKTGARIAALELACAPKIDRGLGEGPVASTDTKLVDWFNQRLAALSERHPGDVTVISINDKVCPNGKAVDKLDGVRLRSDGVHWTERGAPQAWTWLLPSLFDLAYRPSK